MNVDAIQKVIQSAASLLWPLIVIVLILRFKPALAAIIDSAKSREFTLEIGGQKLTMKEANQVQQNLIADLQNKVSEIQKRLDGGVGDGHAIAQGVINEPARAKALLWVDDTPKNNSYFIQQLSQLGVMVDLAESTAEGIAKFGSKSYDFVISDMGRREGLGFNSTAGIDLLKSIRERDKQIPFVLFSGSKALREYGDEARKLGASAGTSSPTELFGILNLGEAKGLF